MTPIIGYAICQTRERNGMIVLRSVPIEPNASILIPADEAVAGIVPAVQGA